MIDAIFMKYTILGLIVVIGLLIYFNFRVIAYYVRQVSKLEAKYTNLAEMRETTKIEDVMMSLERDIKAQNYLHEQEMMSAFYALKSFVSQATGFKEPYVSRSEPQHEKANHG